MRLGIYGGTFDPVHWGHLILAEQCREQLELDKVWFVPAGVPPHKSDAGISAARDRFAMLELAVAGAEHFVVSRLEVDRSDPCFTVDTLERLHIERPDDELFFLMGADSLRDFPTWRRPERIVELATVVAVNRGDDRDGRLPDWRSACGIPDERLRIVTMPGIALSATDIRERAASGRSIRYLVPRAVEVYLQQHGLYRDNPSQED